MTDELLLIEGISRKRYNKLKAAAIDSLDQVLDVPHDELGRLLGMETNPASIEDLLLRARLFKERKLLVKRSISLPDPKNVVFYDIEAGANRHNMFLVSFLEMGSKPVTIYNGKPQVFGKKIADFLSSHHLKTFVSSSGNHFDKKYLVLALKQKGLWKPSFDDIAFLDLMKYLKPRLVTPVGFSVKKLSHLFGYHDYERELHDDPLIQSLIKKLRIHPKRDSVGYLFALAYEKKVLNGKIWEKMIEYNIEDVRAVQFIYSRLYELVNGVLPETQIPF